MISHWQALAQVDGFLRSLPGVVQEAVDDTAGAAQMVADQQLTCGPLLPDPGSAVRLSRAASRSNMTRVLCSRKPARHCLLQGRGSSGQRAGSRAVRPGHPAAGHPGQQGQCALLSPVASQALARSRWVFLWLKQKPGPLPAADRAPHTYTSVHLHVQCLLHQSCPSCSAAKTLLTSSSNLQMRS